MFHRLVIFSNVTVLLVLNAELTDESGQFASDAIDGALPHQFGDAHSLPTPSTWHSVWEGRWEMRLPPAKFQEHHLRS